MNKKRKELIEKLIDINYDLLNLTDEQLSVVFLADNSGKEQRVYTQGLLEGLELAQEPDQNILSSVRVLTKLLSRKDLTLERAFELEENLSKDGYSAIGIRDFMDLDFSYTDKYLRFIEKYCEENSIDMEEWADLPSKKRKGIIHAAQLHVKKAQINREEKGNDGQHLKVTIEGLTEG
jgi:ribonucleotide monophosphatase NagD (HAD superfamily)